jgi:hypothetical protein
LFENLIGSPRLDDNLSCNASVCVRLDLLPDYDKISCRENALGDAIILQASVLLAAFVLGNAQKFALICDQWVNGIMVVSGVVAFKSVHKVWSGLGVKRKEEFTSKNGSKQPWNNGTIDGA